MTREEAIARIKNHKIAHKMNEPRAIYISEALDMAIEELEQEPCEDAISRQAVLEYIEGSEAELGHSSENELVCQYIKELPPVVPKWIPCATRLPDKSEYGDVLVTYIPSGGTLWATVMIAQYSDLMGIAEPCFHIGEVGKKSYRNITSQVTAWTPLPKPYKAERS